MPWVRFEDKFDEDEDLDFLSPEAVALHLCACTWSSRHLTDGVIPEARVRKLFGYSPEALELLLTAAAEGNDPWWIKTANGYRIRSFLLFNPSAESVKDAREQRAAAGKKSAEIRWGSRVKNNGSLNGSLNGKQHESSQVTKPEDAPNVPVEPKNNGSFNGSLRKKAKNRNEMDAPYPVSRIPNSPKEERSNCGDSGSGKESPASVRVADGMFQIPEKILPLEHELRAFVKSRTVNGKKATMEAMRLLCKKLETHPVEECRDELQKSTVNGWADVFYPSKRGRKSLEDEAFI